MFSHHDLPEPIESLISYVLLENVPDADYYLISACIILTALVFVQLNAFSRPNPVPKKKLPKRPCLSILFKPDDVSVTHGSERKPRSPASWGKSMKSINKSLFRSGDHDEYSDHSDLSGEEEDITESTTVETPHNDLPDSFAPLLSSSQVEVLHDQLTANLVHAVQVEASVRIRAGLHEIPLDKDSSRPQFRLEVPKGGCRLSALASVGSDGLTFEEDLDIGRKTTSRSLPMVKYAGVALDPPLPLSNVAPTLIHVPTLFEDKFVTHNLRRIQIVRFVMDFVVSISSLIERVLWIFESYCQIHLSKVRITPMYKGRSVDCESPEWRLILAFSGHVMLFGWIPIPFISVVLPSFIIPQPHALLENLLTPEPLASAKLRRENIAEEKIAMAVIDTADTWNVDAKVVVTPPAVGVDVSLPGGVGVALEMVYGRDPGASSGRDDARSVRLSRSMGDSNSVNSMSSWSTKQESTAASRRSNAPPSFDANQVVPWFIELSAKGSVSHEKMSFHLLKLAANHQDMSTAVPMKSELGTRGSVAIWRGDLKKNDMDGIPFRGRRSNAFHMSPLTAEDVTPSIAEVLLFPDDHLHPGIRLLNYDYAFEVFDNTRLDSMTILAGATHPMLQGGTMITTILENIYAFGSISARQDAVLDPYERHQKRNILKHLPAINFTFGVQNISIPQESMSYSDFGQGNCVPEMDGGRMLIRFLGGTEGEKRMPKEGHVENPLLVPVADGVKVVAEFGVNSFVLNSKSYMKEFPELDIFEGAKLKAHIAGMVSGSLASHLRPINDTDQAASAGAKNIFNPLEAYEIDMSGSSLSLKLKESTVTLDHRRVIIPTETTVMVEIIESIVDMTLEGKTKCELCWDFQGLSPILQVAEFGKSPAEAAPESKNQVSLLVAPLRQGRFTLNVSSVGGINITKAATSREDKEGLYDWKFFNAFVSPDETSLKSILDVLNDKRTMDKLLQVARLLNNDLYKILDFALDQFWRAMDIFDREGISEPKHIVPAHKMARLISLILSGDTTHIDALHGIIQRVVAGDGLDAVAVKEVLQVSIEAYEDWAPEIDRAIRWAAVALSCSVVDPPHDQGEVPPLAEERHHACRFRHIPSAKELYDQIHEKPHLPLDPNFSNLVSGIAPYLSFQQIEYFLKIRSANDWQPSDLRRIRYVYSIKRRVLEIAESYGGLSFLPQSFLVSVFLGEATRASLRASGRISRSYANEKFRTPRITMSKLKRQRGAFSNDDRSESFVLTPASKIAAMNRQFDDSQSVPEDVLIEQRGKYRRAEASGPYELGDSLLGPHDVAILLQAGLTSAMKSSTVVQLNQRMILDLMASQPKSFAVAVLAEIGTHGSQASPRGLTSALMALLDMDQSSFKPIYQIDMHALLEKWLPGMKIPKLDDYMAGGRWARQSYYEAIFNIATSILDDSECYMALKSHIQRNRNNSESDAIPGPRMDHDPSSPSSRYMTEYEYTDSKLKDAVDYAKQTIDNADAAGNNFLKDLLWDEKSAKASVAYKTAIQLYRDAFDACRRVLALDKLAFHSRWFRDFYKRNYDALMIKSMLDNIIDDVDNVRYWMQCMRLGALRADLAEQKESNNPPDEGFNLFGIIHIGGGDSFHSTEDVIKTDKLFLEPHQHSEQVLLEAIIDASIYEERDREALKTDPLVRLLIPNPPGKYNFTIVTAMGVITDGKKGLELEASLKRIKEERGVSHIRADTGTARSLEYNAGKIKEAFKTAVQLRKPYGIIGYSQGCPNSLMAESLLLSGSPEERKTLENEYSGLVARQLLFSAANGSVHGPAMDKKAQRLIIMCEEFFKYQQGYVSRALASTVLQTLTNAMDSAQFQKGMGGAQSFMTEGCRAFWREAQHLPHVPTCTLSGVMEAHNTPETLEMLGNALAKQSGSILHDSQVHTYDAVGYPVYLRNRNARLLRKCAIGEGAIQRTHHWSPLSDEVEFVNTERDLQRASFDCAKDRHVFPWVDVNVRFGFIKYVNEEMNWLDTEYMGANAQQPYNLVRQHQRRSFRGTG